MPRSIRCAPTESSWRRRCAKLESRSIRRRIRESPTSSSEWGPSSPKHARPSGSAPRIWAQRLVAETPLFFASRADGLKIPPPDSRSLRRAGDVSAVLGEDVGDVALLEHGERLVARERERQVE